MYYGKDKNLRYHISDVQHSVHTYNGQARGYKYEAQRYIIKFGIVTNHRRIVVEVSVSYYCMWLQI